MIISYIYDLKLTRLLFSLYVDDNLSLSDASKYVLKTREILNFVVYSICYNTYSEQECIIAGNGLEACYSDRELTAIRASFRHRILFRGYH